MFTYLYTSNWAQGVPGWKPILYYAIAFAVPLALLFVPKLRKVGVAGAVAVAIVVGGLWPFKIELEHLKGKDLTHSGVKDRPKTGYGVLNWYIVGCAPNWSQKRVIQTYYKLRKSPEEQLIAWQFNWRGETWYTGAQVVVSKSLKNEKIIAWLKKPEHAGRKFFFITERSRYASLRNMLPTAKGKKTLQIVDNSNVHYILASAEI
jgi:hypothetical protein